ncbi:MAG: protease [Gammaproteobacteria bacterium HGW-Gammaproteobacteria-14]|nr:MAG: protease [Gammaproteobacteria bacterium HGW-Gammaproteobacteria-14]
MNFFEHQERARRRTGLLATYFIAAVAAIVVSVSVVIYIALLWVSGGDYSLLNWLYSPVMHWSTAITLLIVITGSLHKTWQIRDGGVALADMLNAREILPSCNSLADRRLRNVVEEMAIASGIPAPRTFVMPHEKSINALAAGFRPTEAVIVITQGALDSLNREELQGVIAHEFSHIFNADMRINMRLIAVLAGILAIGKVGEFLIHANTRMRLYNRRRDKNEVLGIFFLILLGIAMMVIGYIGLFFGRLIKAAISRQRELLADASSVQFTRNASGIANALIKIRNHAGSHLMSVHGEDMSHMCFGETVPFHLQSLLATHPPLDNRLRALGNEWLARARTRQRAGTPLQTPSDTLPDGMGFAGSTPVPPGGAAERVTAGTTGQPVSPTVGTVLDAHLGYARSIIGSIPEDLRNNLQHAEPARLVVLALAMGTSQSEPAALLPLLDLNTVESQQVLHLVAQIRTLGTRIRLPLIDMALPALQQLSNSQREQLLEKLEQLVLHDQRLTLFEFVLTRILKDHLGDNAGRAPAIRFRQYPQLANQIQLILSLMVHASGSSGGDADLLFRRASGTLLPPGRILLPLEKCRIEDLDQALADLRDLTPLLKAPLLDALADIARADSRIQVQQAELLRGIATLMDCPMPPLF